MKLRFIYSPVEEIKEVFNMIFHYGDYKNLRSVVWPTPRALFSFALNQKKAVRHAALVWEAKSEELDKAFRKLGLKDPGEVNCYVHGVSCEGWFDTDNNSIHIRVTKEDSDKELLNTITHELLHLSTYEDDFSHEQREELVDKYLSRLDPILGRVPVRPQSPL